MPVPYRLGCAVKILGAGGLATSDARRWQNGPSLTRSLELLLACALEKNREARIRSMEEFMAALSGIAAEPLPGAPIHDLDWGDERARTHASRPFNPRATQQRRAARRTTRT